MRSSRCMVVDTSSGIMSIVASVVTEDIETKDWVDVVAPKIVMKEPGNRVILHDFGNLTDGKAKIRSSRIISHSDVDVELAKLHMDLVADALGGRQSEARA